ncbi:MAG: hypothetical protein LBU32_27800 [Clostridiales bacterium]|jgi:hypothetical protein|nr:hypothetical protein [Clostridiales bacterium]
MAEPIAFFVILCSSGTGHFCSLPEPELTHMDMGIPFPSINNPICTMGVGSLLFGFGLARMLAAAFNVAISAAALAKENAGEWTRPKPKVKVMKGRVLQYPQIGRHRETLTKEMGL